jgi:hypothetical protein
MNEQTFSLQPFTAGNLLPDVQITGTISRNNHQLAISYQLLGELTEIAISPPSNTPTRKHELWQDTCFEFFVGIQESERYWEFNLSPSGDWNVYRFDSYRQGMQEETAFIELPFYVEKSDSFTLNLDVDLLKIVSPKQGIDLAITSVVKQKNNQVTYWALVHKGTKPDFHIRDGFVIKI